MTRTAIPALQSIDGGLADARSTPAARTISPEQSRPDPIVLAIARTLARAAARKTAGEIVAARIVKEPVHD